MKISRPLQIVLVLVLAGIGVAGYHWYATEKSPSIMGGGYDREMEEKQEIQDEALPAKPVVAPTVAPTPAKYLPASWKTSSAESVSYEVGELSPTLRFNQIAAADLNASSPVAALALYYKLLSEGKIEEAARLSDDPKTTADSMNAYKERVGEETFKQQFSQGFQADGPISVSAVAKVQDTYIVLLNTGSYVGTNVLVPVGSTYVLNSNPFSLSKDIQAVVDAVSKTYNP